MPAPSATKPRGRSAVAAPSRGRAPTARDRSRRRRRSTPGGRASPRRDTRGGALRTREPESRPNVSAVALHATTETAKSRPKTTSSRTASAEVQRQPDDERRQRSAEELHLRERRLGVEELEVVDEVVPGVPPLRHRPAERPGTRRRRARARRERQPRVSSARTRGVVSTSRSPPRPREPPQEPRSRRALERADPALERMSPVLEPHRRRRTPE